MTKAERELLFYITSMIARTIAKTGYGVDMSAETELLIARALDKAGEGRTDPTYTEADRELLFFMARMLASRADPAGKVAPEIERLLARAIDAAMEEKRGA